MNELRIFNNPEFGSVRTVTINGEYWFVGSDVARALGYSKLNEAVRTNTREMDTTTAGVIDSIGRTQQMVVINESGMYDMIFESRLPKAKDFRHWVTSDVLPELRRTGSYSIQSKPDSYTISDPVERAKRWIEEQEESRREKRALEEKVSVLEPDASAFQALCDSKLLTNFRDGAKELGMSQSQLIGWLKREKYIYSTSKGELRPMEPYRKSDLFQMKSYTNPYNGFSGIQTYLTPKGLQYFKMQLEARGIMPDALPKHGGRNGRKKR